MIEINGDNKLGFLKSIIYTFNFLIEYLLEKKNTKNYFFENNIKNLRLFWDNNKLLSYSPMRIATDCYLVSYLINNFAKDKKIHILDLGCGNGIYANQIRNLGFNIKYIGIDLKHNVNWKNIDGDNLFIEDNLTKNHQQIFKKIKKKFNIDLVLSHSFFEHISNDKEIFISISNIFTQSNHLHFIPATISFLNYFRHGYRRYNNYKIKKILQKTNYFYNIYTLGNHYTLIHYFRRYYLFYRKKHKLDFLKIYKKKLDSYEDISKYIYAKKGHYPIFYCLLKLSN
tara:strand:+ start:1162 stop:2013 length:852 start_codon:yes stop_codon:yes gene_type:complete